MTVELGDLVSELMDRFEHRLHDHALAAIATQIALADVLARGKRRGAGRAASRR